tara:strand:+ start:1193 stop:2158 length:966 start_codon:yes stop_codon:yes gene_type:complete
MKTNRRKFLATTGLISIGSLIPKYGFGSTKISFDKLNTLPKFEIGAITYSYRSLPGNLYSIIGYCKESGISDVELMANNVEAFLGIPYGGTWIRRNNPNYQQIKDEQKAWRESVSIDKFKNVKTLLDQAGISVYAYKPSSIGPDNSDLEIEQSLMAAKVLGASSVTVEINEGEKYATHTQRLGDLGRKHGIYIGYHAHTQATDILWNNALNQSNYNSINLDIGHYIARGKENTSETLLTFIKNNHSRITSMHIKDRHHPDKGAENKPFGEGDTPILEVIKLVHSNGYKIPLSIEFEYKTPEKSNAVREVKKCLEYCKQALI